MGALRFVGPAFQTALEEVKRDYPFLNMSQTFVITTDNVVEEYTCGESSDIEIAEYYYTRRQTCPIDGQDCWTLFILSGCTNSIAGQQRFANGVNKVLMASGVTSAYQTDKSSFPTLLSSVITQSSPIFLATFLKLIQLYQWEHVTIVTEIGGLSKGYESGARGIYRLISSVTPQIQVTFIPVSLTGPVNVSVLNNILDRFAASSRVMILAADSLLANKLLIQARVRGMTDGSYVYIITSSASVPFSGSRLRNISDEHHFEEARKSYPSCILVDLGADRQFIINQAMAPTYPFVDAWKLASKRDYNYTYPPDKQVANELRLQHLPVDFNNGALLAKQFFGRTFQTKVGNVTFDQLGQRVPQVLIGYYDVDNDSFIPFLAYEPRPNFPELENLRQHKWSGGLWPVPSTPRCGFNGMGCDTRSAFQSTAIGVGLSVVVLISTAALLVGRRQVH
ncbi:hypothetical protein BV898_13299 [Hypsibius exemplaris]|uniref:Receptor ligand binding region domain-containing protein n=1 Tax=Hypsibius exemplaris TaxID=2072580 RepID=A0A1W0WB85_HYPEX|nr:hypothetical protein BV898_13299 [Hypsibius exemplaris]